MLKAKNAQVDLSPLRCETQIEWRKFLTYDLT